MVKTALKYAKKIIDIRLYKSAEISKFYNICDLFVFPSIFETGPQVILEARACGAVLLFQKMGGKKNKKKWRRWYYTK